MQLKSSKRKYNVVVEYPNGVTRNVVTKATSRPKAEAKALKFHPNAIGVKRETS